MTKKEKILEDIKNNPNDVSPELLHSLLIYYGFIHRCGKGSHQIYKHPKYTYMMLSVPNRRPIKAIYVKRAIEYIDDIIAFRQMGD